MPTKKEKDKSARVQIYFPAELRENYDDLIAFSKLTHRSVSEIAFSCFIFSFYDEKMREALLRGSGVVVRKSIKKK